MARNANRPISRTAAVSRGLRTRGSAARRSLAGSIRGLRALDRQPGVKSYCITRGPGSPGAVHGVFKVALEEIVRGILARNKGRIAVLEKGSGQGNMAAWVKKFAPQRIHMTALNLSQLVAKKNARAIDRMIIGTSVRGRAPGKFDLIFDEFGEDFHMPKKFKELSIERSIASLNRGGELLTVIPLKIKGSGTRFGVSSGIRLARRLAARKGIKASCQLIDETFDLWDQPKLLIRITKT